MAKLNKARKSIRFNPDPGTIAQLSFSAASKPFKAEHNALVLSESYGGCSILMAHPPEISLGDKVRLKLGELAPMVGEVRWIIALDEHILKVGFMYEP